MGVVSAPTTSATSQSPARIRERAVSIAWAPVAQAAYDHAQAAKREEESVETGRKLAEYQRQREALQAALPKSAHLPAGKFVGSFQKVLAIQPYEAKSFSTRERNPYMLVLEVSEVVETEDGLADSESIASSIHELRTKRSRGAGASPRRAAPPRRA